MTNKDGGKRVMTLKDFRELTKNLPDDFEINVSVDTSREGERPFNFDQLYNISVDIGYSSKVVHFFGDLHCKS